MRIERLIYLFHVTLQRDKGEKKLVNSFIVASTDISYRITHIAPPEALKIPTKLKQFKKLKC